MGEAAPQAAHMEAEGLDVASLTSVSRALEALRLQWGGLYLLGWDEERGWWAARHGRTGHLLTAPGPSELGKAITRDKRRPPEENEALRRTARNYGLAAYRLCVRAGDEETAARVAGEMTALGLLEPGDHLPGREAGR
jgi:hypothetical protein